MFNAIERLSRAGKPVVVFAPGTAVGGHLGVGTMGLLVVSSDPKAKYAMPEIRLSLPTDAASTHQLPRRVGLGFALYMALTGYELSGAEARYRGLADVCLRPEDFPRAETELRAWAKRRVPCRPTTF